MRPEESNAEHRTSNIELALAGRGDRSSVMRVLYGLASEGMGHAIRSKVVLDWLEEGHEVMVVCGGRGYGIGYRV